MKYIIKAFNYLVGFIFMFSLCAVDSTAWWPMIVLAASGVYLVFLAWRSGLMAEMEESE